MISDYSYFWFVCLFPLNFLCVLVFFVLKLATYCSEARWHMHILELISWNALIFTFTEKRDRDEITENLIFLLPFSLPFLSLSFPIQRNTSKKEKFLYLNEKQRKQLK